MSPWGSTRTTATIPSATSSSSCRSWLSSTILSIHPVLQLPGSATGLRRPHELLLVLPRPSGSCGDPAPATPCRAARRSPTIPSTAAGLWLLPRDSNPLSAPVPWPPGPRTWQAQQLSFPPPWATRNHPAGKCRARATSSGAGGLQREPCGVSCFNKTLFSTFLVGFFLGNKSHWRGGN